MLSENKWGQQSPWTFPDLWPFVSVWELNGSFTGYSATLVVQQEGARPSAGWSWEQEPAGLQVLLGAEGR